MSDHNLEKEIKVEIKNPQDLVAKLVAKKAKSKGESFLRTTRMDTENMDLEKSGVFLRVRSGFKNVVTLKRKLKEKNADVFEREEIETEIQDIEKLADIFGGLGFNKRLIMEKYRKDFDYKGVTISIDELPFGFFVELEGEPKDIFEVAKDLEIDTENKITVTYWDIFEDWKKKNNGKGESIVFPNDYKSKLLV